MNYVLVKFESDWADEYDVYGFKVFTEEQYKHWLLNELVDFPTEVYFGTNEGFEFNSFEEYKDKIEDIKISQEEYDVLKKLFGREYYDGLEYGNFIDPSYH